jgi:uncharacterized protein (DUF1499 family)
MTTKAKRFTDEQDGRKQLSIAQGAMRLMTVSENLFHVSVTMKDGDNLQGLALRTVNDQIRIDREKSYRFVRQVLATVPTTRIAGQKIELLANDCFNPVRDLNVGLPLDVPQIWTRSTAASGART